MGADGRYVSAYEAQRQEYVEQLGGEEAVEVRKMPSWSRSWTDFSLL
jgi:hypothetical protein